MALLCGLAIQKWTCFSRCSQLCSPTHRICIVTLCSWAVLWLHLTNKHITQVTHELRNPELRSPCQFLPLPRGTVWKNQKLKRNELSSVKASINCQHTREGLLDTLAHSVLQREVTQVSHWDHKRKELLGQHPQQRNTQNCCFKGLHWVTAWENSNFCV